MTQGLLIIFVGLFSIQVMAARINNQLLVCLGQEELRIHKIKLTGPTYRLNRTLIEEFVTFSDIIIKEDHLKKICNSGLSSPSVELLKYLLIEKTNLFDFSTTKNKTERLRLQTKANGLIVCVPQIFLRWIANIQALCPTADCLDKHIPHLKYLKFRIQYLEDELPVDKLIDSPERVRSVFNSLKNLDSIIRNCNKDKKRREKLLKKKQRR